MSSYDDCGPIDQISDRFESAWQWGSRPSLDLYVQKVKGRADLVRDLVHIDLENRIRAGDQTPLVEMYLKLHAEEFREPDHAMELISVEFEHRWRREGASRQEYVQRFPIYGEALRTRLRIRWLCPLDGRQTVVEDDAATEVWCRECRKTQPARPPLPLHPHEGEDGQPSPDQSLADWPRIPGFEILAKLDDQGGMGIVYKARRTGANPSKTPQRDVALKMIASSALIRSDGLARFYDEIRAAAKLDHDHIVRVYDWGELRGLPYFSMEFCPGGSLASRLGRAPMVAEEAAKVVQVLAEAAHYAHRKEIIHRDLKPANVLFAADGKPKLSDFGLAKHLDSSGHHTGTGIVLGTPSYMAPEQAAGGKPQTIDARTDVYALGAILYECLTGRPPFLGVEQVEILRLVCEQEPVPPRRFQPETPRNLETICLKCLQKDPGRRYESADALAQDIGRYLDKKPILARPVGPLEKTGLWCHRNPLLAAVVTSALVLLIAFTVVSGVFAITKSRDNVTISNNAETLRQTNTQLEKTANKAQARALAAQAELLRNQRPNLLALSTRLSAESMRLYPSAEADATLRHGLDLLPRLIARMKHVNSLSVMRSPDPRTGKRFYRRGPELLMFSPDARYLATLSGGSIRVWEANSGREAIHINKSAAAMIFASTGEYVAAAGNKAAYVWDATTGKQTFVLHFDPSATAVAFSPDGRLLAVATGTSAQIWDVARGQIATKAPKLAHGSYIRALAFSKEGKYLAIAGGRRVRTWEVPTGRHFDLEHDDEVQLLAWKPGGEYLVTASGPVLSYWDLRTQQRIVLPPTRSPLLALLESIVFSSDGRFLAIAGSTGLRVLGTNDWQPTMSIDQPIEVVAFSPDCRYITGAAPGGAWVWESATGKEMAASHSITPLVGSCRNIEFSPDGQNVAVSGLDDVVLWAWQGGGSRAMSITGANKIAFKRDGKYYGFIGRKAGPLSMAYYSSAFANVEYYFRGSNGGFLSQWPGPLPSTPETNEEQAQRNLPNGAPPFPASLNHSSISLSHDGIDHEDIETAGFSPDGKYIATGQAGKTLVWELQTGEELTGTNRTEVIQSVVLRKPEVITEMGMPRQGFGMIRSQGQGGLGGFALRPNSRSGLSDPKEGAEGVGAPTGIGRPSPATALLGGETRSEPSREEQYRITTSSNLVRVQERTTGKDLAQIATADRVLATAYEGSTAAIALSDHTVRICDLVSGRETKRVVHDADVAAVTFDSSGKRLATTTTDGMAWIWNLSATSEVARMVHDSAPSNSFRFTPDGRSLAVFTSGMQMTDSRNVLPTKRGAYLWDTKSWKLLSNLIPPKEGNHHTLSPDGLYVAYVTYPSDQVNVLSTKNGKSIYLITPIRGHQVDVFESASGLGTRIVFSPDSKQLITITGGRKATNSLQVWDVATGHEDASIDLPSQVTQVDFSPDKRWLAVSIGTIPAPKGPSVIVYDFAKGVPVAELFPGSFAGSVNFIQGGKFLLVQTGGPGVNPTVFHLLELPKWKETRSIPLQKSGTGFSLSNDGRFLAASEGTSAGIWELPSGKKVGQVSQENHIWGISFSFDGKYLATFDGRAFYPFFGPSDHSVHVWELHTRREIANIEHPSMVCDAIFSSDGTYIVTADYNGVACVWCVQSNDLINEARTRLTRNLTRDEWLHYFPDEPYTKRYDELP